MAEQFGLGKVGSVEAFFDTEAGWCFRGYEGPGCSGPTGGKVLFAGDASLGAVVLNTAPTILANAGYVAVSKWTLDDATRTASVDTAPLEQAASVELDFEQVDAILDAETRWAREGVGSVTPNGLNSWPLA